MPLSEKHKLKGVKLYTAEMARESKGYKLPIRRPTSISRRAKAGMLDDESFKWDQRRH